MKKLYFSLLTFLFFIGFANAQTQDIKEIAIKTGEKYRDSLASKSLHSYTIPLDSAQFVRGLVNQLSVDVVVSVKGPKGHKIASFDGPGKGPENFQFSTRSTGIYKIEITPFEEKVGTYVFLLSKVEPIATKPEARVDQLMTPYSGKNTPGAAIMVMQDDEIIFQEAYGMANLTYGIPFKTTTPNNIGSTSKQFTAFAVCLLADRGKLSLDDDIRKHIPELPDFGKTVTVRNLLTHTSGYREFLNTLALAGLNLGSDLNREKIIKLVQNQPKLQNDPGAEWNYNNTGYSLLATLVKRISGTPFPEWMQENVFEPLEMNHTMVRRDHHEIVPGGSQGYNLNTNGEFQAVIDLGGAMGAGGIYTTLEDLAKWIQNFENPKVGNEKIINAMTTPFVLTTGDTTNYGLGLFIGEHNGLKMISHGGADVAHRSMLMYFPEIDAAVVAQSNNSMFNTGKAFEIADSFFSEYMTIEKSKKPETSPKPADFSNFNYEVEKFDQLAGRYELKEVPGFVLEFNRDGDRIYTKATGQPQVDMFALSNSEFKLIGVDAKIDFHLNEDGTADSLTLHQNGKHKAHRITWKPKEEELMDYTGAYFSTEIQTMYHIIWEKDTLKLKSYLFPEKITLKPAKKDSFSGSFPIGNVEFTRNTEEKITGFKVSNGRARGIFFKKVNLSN